MEEILKKIIKRIVEEVNPDQIILFGSRAKGKTEKDSDYDLFVLKKGIFKQKELEEKIYLGLFGTGAPVDVIIENPKRYEELKDNPFLIYNEVAKFGKVIYDKRKTKQNLVQKSQK